MKDDLKDINLTDSSDHKTCFAKIKHTNTVCTKSNCRQWIEHEACLNCVLISSQNGPKTLQEIGDMFGITRMRICQIEKAALSKLIKKI